MSLNCGIIGLPNAGKSTLFNALTRQGAAQAANYPFCTIEPNQGQVMLADERLEKIAALAGSAEIKPTSLEIVDIAGLVRGASKGEGLGNSFLSHIREVDALIHVVRCFEDGDIIHVEGRVNPLEDIDIINTELLLADLQSLEKRRESLVKKSRDNQSDSKAQLGFCDKIIAQLEKGKPARLLPAADIEDEIARSFGFSQLLTAKKTLYLCNIDEAGENAHYQAVRDFAQKEGAGSLGLCAKLEEEISGIVDIAERKELLESLGLEQSGLERLTKAGFDLLSLISYFTAGPKESRAWPVTRGMNAQEAAGVIHSDFARGFISAEIIGWEDYIALGGESSARQAGKMRQEGRDYIVCDGDVILFRFNV